MNTIVDKLTGSIAPWEIGAAIFSTNRGEHGRRIANQYDRPPLVMRSDPDEDMAQMALRLQSQFPSECRAIQCPTDCPIDVYCYFDHYDVYIQGSSYLHEVLSSIAFRNLAQLHRILEFVDSFKSSQVERFNDIYPDTQDLFTEEEKSIHSQEFLEDALIRLKALKLAAGNMGRISEQRLGDVQLTQSINSAKQESFTPSEAFPLNAPNSGTLKVNEVKRQSSAPDHALGSLIDNSSTSFSLDTRVNSRRFSSAPSPPRALEILVKTDVDVAVERATEAESSTESSKLDLTAHPRRRSSVSAPFSPRHRPLPQRVASAQGVYSADIQQKQRRREHYTDPEPQYANPTDQHLGGYQLLGPIVRLDSNEAGYPTVKAIPMQTIYADNTLPRIPQYGELAVVKNDSQQAYYNRIENVQVQGRAGNRQSDHRRFDSRRSRQLSYQGPPDNLPADLHFTTNQRQAVGYRSTITTPGMRPINAIVWGKSNDTNNFHHPGAYSPLPYYAPQPEVFHSRRTSQPNMPRRRQTLQDSQIFPSDNRRGPPGPGAHTFGQPGPPGPLYVTKTRPPMGFSNDARVLAYQEGQYRGRQLSDAMPYRTVSDSPRYNPSWPVESPQTHMHQFQDPQSLAIALTSGVDSRRGSDRFYQHPNTGLDMTNQTIVDEQAGQPAATPMGLQFDGGDSRLRQVSSGGWSMDTNPYARQEGNEAGMPSYMPINANGSDHKSGLLAINQVHNQGRSSFGYQHSRASDMLKNTSALRPEIGPVFISNTSIPSYQPSPSTINDTQHEGMKLWVSGDETDVQKETLLELFSQCGTVEDIVILRPEKYYSYAFILYEIAEHAARAIDRFNQSPIASLNGRSLRVKYAEQRNRRRLNRSSMDKGPSGYRPYQPTNRKGNGGQGKNPGHPSMVTMPHTGTHNQPENVPYHNFQGSRKNKKKPPSSSKQSSPEKLASNSVGGTKMQEHLDSTSTQQPQILYPHPQFPAQLTTRRNQKFPTEDQYRNQNEPPKENQDRNSMQEKDMPTFQQENRNPMQATSTHYEDYGTQSSSQIKSKHFKGNTPGNPDDLAPVQDCDVRKEAKAKTHTAIETSENTASKVRRGQPSNHWSNSSSKPIALEDYMRPRSSQKRKKERQGLSTSGSVSTPLYEPHGDYVNSDQAIISAPHPELDHGTSLSLTKPDSHAEHKQADDMIFQPTQHVYEDISNATKVNVPVEKESRVISLMEEKSISPPNDTSGSRVQEETPPTLQKETSSPITTEVEVGHPALANNSTWSTSGCLHDVREDNVPPELSDRLSDLVKKPQSSSSSLKEDNIVGEPSSEEPSVPDEINLSDQVGRGSVLSSEDDIFAVSSHKAIVIRKGSDLSQETEEPSTRANMIDAVSKPPSATLMTPVSGPAIAVVNTPEVVGLGQAVLGLDATPDGCKVSKVPEISSPSSFCSEQVLGILQGDTIQDSPPLPSPGTIEVMSTPIETRKRKQFGTKPKRFPVSKKSVTQTSNIFDCSQTPVREGQESDEAEEQALRGSIESEVSGKGIGFSFESIIHKEDELPTSNVSERNEEPIATYSDLVESEEVRNIVRSSCPSPEPLMMVAAQDPDGNDNIPGEDTMNSSEANIANDSAAASPTAPKGKAKKKKSKKKKKAKNEEASMLDAGQSPAVDGALPNKHMPEPEMPWVLDDTKSKEPKVRTYNHPLLRQLDIQESTSPSDSQSKIRRLRAMTDIDVEAQSLRAELVSQPHVVALLDETQRERADRAKKLMFSQLRAAFEPRKSLKQMKDKIKGMVDSGLSAESSSKLDLGERSKEQQSSVSQAPVNPWKVIEDYYTEKAHYSEMLHNVRQAPLTIWTDGGDSSSSPRTIMDDSPEGFSPPLHDNPTHLSTDQNTEDDPTATTIPAPNFLEDIMSSANAKVGHTNLLERLGKVLGISNVGDDTMDEVNQILRGVEDASEARAAASVVDFPTIRSVDDSEQPTTDNTRRTSPAELGTYLTLDTTRRTSIIDISDDSSKSRPAIKTPSSSPESTTNDSTNVGTPTPTSSRRAKQAIKRTEEATPIDHDTKDMLLTHTPTKSKGDPFTDLQFTQQSELEENILSTDIEKGSHPILTPLQHSNDDTISTSIIIPSTEGENADYGVADKTEDFRHTTSMKISFNDAKEPSTIEAASYMPSSPGACLFPDETISFPAADHPPKATNIAMEQDHECVEVSSPPSTPEKISTRASPTKRSPQVKAATIGTAEYLVNDSLPPLPPSPKDGSTSNVPAPHSPKAKGKAISTNVDLDLDPPSRIPQPYTPTRKDFSTSANSGMEILNSLFIPSGVEDLSPNSSPPKSHFRSSNVATAQSGVSEASEEERSFTERVPMFEEFLGNTMNGGDPWSVPSGEKRWGSRRGKK